MSGPPTLRLHIGPEACRSSHIPGKYGPKSYISGPGPKYYHRTGLLYIITHPGCKEFTETLNNVEDFEITFMKMRKHPQWAFKTWASDHVKEYVTLFKNHDCEEETIKVLKSAIKNKTSLS